MDAADRIAEVLDRQYEDYRAMHALGMEQRSRIAEEDLSGLDASFGRVHHLMDRIRLRQAELDELCAGSGIPPRLTDRREALRSIVSELQDLRRANERAVRRLLDRTREEARQMDQGRRAVRGYRSTAPQAARFFDGTR